ncbi:MAG: sel1 repeat family protein [Magnetococcales bacterium]|nr:sel1 repeat family protein [Magnetococcales bacterium]
MKFTPITDLFLDQQDEAFTNAVRSFERQDYAQAFTAFETLAKQDDPQAQINLAIMLRDGLGRSADPVAALAWLERAVSQGDEIARVEHTLLKQRLTTEQVASASLRSTELLIAA